MSAICLIPRVPVDDEEAARQLASQLQDEEFARQLQVSSPQKWSPTRNERINSCDARQKRTTERDSWRFKLNKLPQHNRSASKRSEDQRDNLLPGETCSAKLATD